MKFKRRAFVIALVSSLMIVSTSEIAKAHPQDRNTHASYYDAAGATGASGQTMSHNSAASKWWKFGSTVKVCFHKGDVGTDDCTKVEILDRCQCGMDMDRKAFIRLFGSTSRGVDRVWMEKVHNKGGSHYK